MQFRQEQGLSGNPNTWTVNGTTIGYFDGILAELPSGTHINNRYHPKMMANKCNQDDIQIKIGALWVDMQGSGQTTSPYWMAFSQKAQASTGMTWFIAQIAANNAGKRLPTNEEWQSAAMGTARSAGNGAAWGASYGNDYTYNVNGSAYGNAGWTNGLPAALLRGDGWTDGPNAGVFALYALHAPSSWGSSIGFRSVR